MEKWNQSLSAAEYQGCLDALLSVQRDKVFRFAKMDWSTSDSSWCHSMTSVNLFAIADPLSQQPIKEQHLAKQVRRLFLGKADQAPRMAYLIWAPEECLNVRWFN